MRVLVTGAGGPAGIAAMRSLQAEESVELIAADMDPWAPGLYLAPERTLVPAGSAPDFTRVLLGLCRTLGVDVVLPTVDAELQPLARERERFAAVGVALLLAPAAALDVILDKLALAAHCAGVVPVPRTELFGPSVDVTSWSYPVVVKPRRGAGSRGVVIVNSAAELAALDRSPGLAKRVAHAGAMVEVNEKWSCPSPRTVAVMLDAGVQLVAGSDSHHCRDVGVYHSVRLTVSRGARA